MTNSTNNKIVLGAALEHGAAHSEQHHTWSRRGFLRNLGIVGGTSMLLGKIPVTALGTSSLGFALNNTETDRVLVLIRLKGGNDGLNTIIPLFDYDRYANFRPDIRVRQNDLINLNNEFAIPKALGGVEAFWKEDAMKIINSVGYPEQNLSHFRSTDIWASASDSATIDNSGWLGRYLGGIYPDYLTNPPANPPAIQIGGYGSLTFNDLNMVSIAVNVNDPQQLAEIAENGQLYDVLNLPECLYGEQVGYLRTIANSTFYYADAISAASNQGSNGATYENNQLANALATVARLIKGNLGTKLYMVTLDGFDTHAQQVNAHTGLMMQLGNAIKSFYEDLETATLQDKVLAMTFSEFGRRIQQNASRGTDHGAAAPVMLFGQGLNGSQILGKKPDLVNLDDTGNLKYDVDFRQIYTTILEDWLCINTTTVNQVMGRSYQRLNLGFECQISSTASALANYKTLSHKWYPNNFGNYTIEYTLPQRAEVQLNIFNALGQNVATLVRANQLEGNHQIDFNPDAFRLPKGQYFYNIQANELRVSGTIGVW